jgi:hypothetical protein
VKGELYMPHTDLMRREVRWYQQHGKYPDRITRTSTGETYVIGDWSWNRSRAGRQEHIESRMRAAGVYDLQKSAV